MVSRLDLPSNPADAKRLLFEESQSRDVVVFKKSPICPVSHAAEAEFKMWARTLTEDQDIKLAEIDVIGEKPLARGLTKELGIDHQSPQALWFRDGALLWHDSHSKLTKARFAAALSGE